MLAFLLYRHILIRLKNKFWSHIQFYRTSIPYSDTYITPIITNRINQFQTLNLTKIKSLKHFKFTQILRIQFTTIFPIQIITYILQYLYHLANITIMRKQIISFSIIQSQPEQYAIISVINKSVIYLRQLINTISFPYVPVLLVFLFQISNILLQ